jgi:hypothetical protein
MMNEREYLRDLAKRLAEHGNKSEQQEKIQLIKNCNDLIPGRPVVYARPENGWNDLLEKWAPARCSDPVLKKIEQNLQMQLIRAERIKDDMPVLPEYPVPMRVRNNTYNDFGFLLEVEQTGDEKGAYHIEPAIADWANMDKLHFRDLLVDREGSRKDLEFTSELFGDILDVYQTGVHDWRYGIMRILIHMRGFQTFLMDMYDYPDELHRLTAFLRDNFQNEIEFYTKEGIITPNTQGNDYIGVGGPCACDTLPDRDESKTFGVKDVCVWAEAQETVGVSPEQFEQFVFQDQKPLVDQFGLCGYGCCEGLEDRFDILKKNLSNLRWLAVSPWADAERMAEQIGSDYVYLYKVNPALVVSPTPDWDAAEKQVRHIHKLTEGMAVQFSLKDTNTFCREPERIERWVEMTKNIVTS